MIFYRSDSISQVFGGVWVCLRMKYTSNHGIIASPIAIKMVIFIHFHHVASLGIRTFKIAIVDFTGF